MIWVLYPESNKILSEKGNFKLVMLREQLRGKKHVGIRKLVLTIKNIYIYLQMKIQSTSVISEFCMVVDS